MRAVAMLLLVLGASAAEAGPRPHWSFQPPRRPPLPAVADVSWTRNPLDVFVLARLEKAGLRPATAAERITLLRRVTFDLTGLPPTPEEVASFLRDQRPDAFDRVVELLLASPAYGERWAQHYLDVVRYAESNGYEADAERPHAFRYRDYVVRSLNADKPYDRFLTEQLAGDLVARTAPPAERAELLIAAGFNRCGPVHQVGDNGDAVVGRQEVLTEVTTAVGSAFLGLTVHCARCHNHKFDPIAQKDYYRLQAFFSAAEAREVDLATPAEKAEHARQTQAMEAQLTPLRRQLAELEAPVRQRLEAEKKARLDAATREALATAPARRTPEQKRRVLDAELLVKVSWDEIVRALPEPERQRRADLRRRMHRVEATRPPPPAQAWTIAEGTGPLQGHVLRRGDPHKPGERVEPGFPAALSVPGSSGDRIALARWLTRPDHPLTARVIVNRLWQHHFGRGLVSTPNDFGTRGSPPTHPELLDYLACELVEHGWSLKHLHRLMVRSSTYRQSSRRQDASARGPRVDPDNHLLWRMNHRRLEGEALRDSALAVASTLNRRLGGPLVRVPLEPEVYELIFTEGEPDNLWPVTPDEREHQRRSLYLFNKRNVRLPLFEAFDQPDTLTSCPVRPVSTFAPQALILLNGPFMQAQARAFAVRLLREADGRTARIDRAYRLALARSPRPAEKQMALDFLEAQTELLKRRLHDHRPVGVPIETPKGVDSAEAAALVDFCLALLNRNAFLYVD